jgi:GNAT superfamily N-acetyltransferase
VTGQRIRAARADDLPVLVEIERAASETFRTLGMHLVADDDPGTVDELAPYAADGRAFVSAAPDDQPIAYLLLDVVDGAAHIEQVSVHPLHARRGLGRELIEHAASWAVARRLHALTLTTYVCVPWNGPYYERLGFSYLGPDVETPGLRALRERERASGLDAWPRACMSRSLRGYGAAPALDGVSIRSAAAAERRALEELQFRASIHSTRYADLLRAHPDAIEVPPWQFEQSLARVAEDGDGVVGFAVLLPPVDGACELDAIFVEPDRMRTGIGRLLIDDAVARARRWGANRIEVVANPDAVEFYERVGFAGNEIVATRFGPGRRMCRTVEPLISETHGHSSQP